MYRNELKNRYIDWLIRLVCDDIRYQCSNRIHLLTLLHDIEFIYTLPMDSNRYEDGVDLRYRFGYEFGIIPELVAESIDDKHCSVLEMMIALAVRCEESIMDDPDMGNRTGKWFWSMIRNLGLQHVTDESFDESYVEHVIFTFLNREYDRDGRGGLFMVPDHEEDFRDSEIWYQMSWYLEYLLRSGGGEELS